jgi:hypothetical protein
VYWHHTTPVTEQFGAGLTHQVFDARAANRMDGDLLRTACGRLITPAPMSAPIGEPCPACAVRVGRSQQEDAESQSLGCWSRLDQLLSLFGR